MSESENIYERGVVIASEVLERYGEEIQYAIPILLHVICKAIDEDGGNYRKYLNYLTQYVETLIIGEKINGLQIINVESAEVNNVAVLLVQYQNELGYYAIVPALSGMIAWGETREEALKKIERLLSD